MVMSFSCHQRLSRYALLGLLVLATCACGQSEPNEGTGGGGSGTGGGGGSAASCGAGIPSADRYLPLAVNNEWSYQVTDPQTGASTKTTVVLACDQFEGKPAFRIETTKPDGNTVSHQADLGTSIVRYFEEETTPSGQAIATETYVPHKLRIDESPEHTAQDATWVDSYVETHEDAMGTINKAKMERWTVEAVEEQVMVPAGSFACLRLRRDGTDLNDPIKRYWFAKGVGKVKEESSQTEELVSYTVE